MLNKNANCCNIEWNFKYSTVISTFIEHITIFRTLSIDIWQLKCPQRQTNTIKNGKLYFFFFVNFSELSNFSSLSFLREATFELKVVPTNHNSWAFLLRTSKTFSNVELFSMSSQTFLELIFAIKIKTMLLKQSAVYVKKLLRILCVWTLKILFTE